MKILLSSLLSEFADNGSVSFYVRARPGMASTRAVEVMDDESIKIDIAAPAQAGKANVELIKYIAREFDVGKDQVSIVSGATARMKLVRVSH